MPSLFRTIANAKGEQRYILVEEGRPFFTPDTSKLRVCIFDNSGRLLNQQEFPTGWRAEITGIKIRYFETINQQTLIVEGQYYFGGMPFHQYYALSGNQIVMIHHLGGYGFDPVSYGLSNFDVGPMIERSADEWEQALESSDTVEILSALMWLSGSHPEIDPAAPAAANNDARNFLTVRARPSVQKRVAQLSESDNFWIKSAARPITPLD